MKTMTNHFNQKKSRLLFTRSLVSFLLLFTLFLMTSCSEDEIAAPQASFTFTTDANRVVTITNTSTNGDKYYWSFGEAGIPISKDENPVHKYSKDGTFNIALSVVGAGGVKQIVQSVTVKEVIPPGIPVPKYKLTTSNLISNFENITNLNDAKTFTWDFGDGNTSNNANPVHTYATAGRYLITFTASGPLGSAVVKDSVSVATQLKINNGSWDEEPVKDDNRTAWRNQLLEKLADTYFADSDYFVKASSSFNHTPGGKNSANLTTNNTSTKPRRWLYQDIIVSPNASYTISFWMLQTPGTNSATYATIYKSHFDLPEYIGVSDKIIKSQTYDDSTGSSTGGWVKQSITFNTGTSSKIVFFMDNKVTATDQSFYDDFEIVKN